MFNDTCDIWSVNRRYARVRARVTALCGGRVTCVIVLGTAAVMALHGLPYETRRRIRAGRAPALVAALDDVPSGTQPAAYELGAIDEFPLARFEKMW